MKKFLKRATLVVALALPAIAWAQDTNEGGSDERRRFWGESTTYGPCNFGVQTVYHHLYIFWIDFGSSNDRSC